jgi:RNA polymerase sigma factor (sigma-70 family)
MATNMGAVDAVISLPKPHSSTALDAWMDRVFHYPLTREDARSMTEGWNKEEVQESEAEDFHAQQGEDSEDAEGLPSDAISDREVLAARKNSELLYHLWVRLEPSVKARMKKVQRVQKHTTVDDLMQEAFEAFHKAIHAYDCRSSGAFVAYYRRYALHTKIRNFSAHDRVIPVPHDTRGSRQSWHRVSESTVQARISAQDLAWPDATEDSGWDSFQSEGDMEEQVVNRMDEEILKQKVLCLPRRWRDLLLLWQRYDNQRIAELTGMNVQEIQDIQNTAMNILRLFGKDRFWVGRTEADYLREWHGLTSQDQGS